MSNELAAAARSASLDLARYATCATCLALGSCSSGESETGETGETGETNTVDAAASTGTSNTKDASPADAEPRESTEAGEALQDRCLTDGCGQSRLLPQPELTFLEDMGDGWKRLLEVDWHIAEGAEGYRCVTFTIPEDVYVTGFAAQVAPGTHHVTFDIADSPQRPDDIYPCGADLLGPRKLQGGGPGTEPLDLPEGVGMPLLAGQQLFMNLHLFNLGQAPLQGRSGMWVRTAAKSELEHEAEVVLAGPLTLDIPPGRSTQRGSCTIREDATLYGVGPHMHQTGVHIRATLIGEDGETTLYDDDYVFDQQLWYNIDEVELAAGDRVDVECTYQNEGDRRIPWGDSGLDEMCFMNLSVYPAIGYGASVCSN